MKRALLTLAILAASAAAGAEPPLVLPYEREGEFTAADPIDACVAAAWKERGITPARLCSDEVFLRRVFIDVIGTLPTPRETVAFLDSKSPVKRAVLIDELLAREEFADLWSLKWCDLFRVKAEFPINLWPNAVQAYHQWIRAAVRDDLPCDRFIRELLTSSGSNFRVPPVNFYRATQGREPAALAEAVALTFLGVRFDRLPENRRAGLAAFFSRLVYKKTAEWKEEIVCLDPAPHDPVEAVFPDGVAVRIPPDTDPRQVFADWLITPKNPWFARNLVNRAWSWLLGRGIIHEADDIRADNPPSNPALLACLESEFVASGWSLRRLFRRILESETYQRSSIPRSDHPEAVALFAHYPVRRLDAEVLIDALCWIGGDGESYSSAIPEPYTHIPGTERTIALADGSITSSFLETFGRPVRDTGLECERNNEPSDAQRLYLLNSSDVRRKLQRSPRLRRLVEANRGNPRALVRQAWLLILSRPPTREEMVAVDAFAQGGRVPREALEDLAWALINTKEFLYRH